MKKILVFLSALFILSIMFLLITFLESLKSGGKKVNIAITTSPPVAYEKVSTQKMLNIVEAKPKLSLSDEIAKQKILDQIGNKNGILVGNNDYSLEYVLSAGSFLVEIKNPSIDFSKQKAINYLKSAGLSENGICNLPLVFYLNPSVAQEYGKEKKEFIPIPDFCT